MNISYRMIFASLAFLQLLLLPAWGREEPDLGDVFGFAESLYAQGDYFRAIGEYKRYIFLQPHNDLTERSTFRIAEAYYHAQRWSEAIEACQVFLEHYPSSSRAYEMLYLEGRIETLDHRYDDAIRTLDTIVAARNPDYSDKAQYQKALIRLEQRNWAGARSYLGEIPASSPLSPLSAALMTEILHEKDLPQKSPVTAGVLAAVLPGAGHLYAERPRDALVSFLLNGVFIWGAVELFQNDNYAAGGLVALFEAGWYGGNIYSAVNSVEKYNRDLESSFLQRIMSRFSVSLQQESGGVSLVLRRRFR